MQVEEAYGGREGRNGAIGSNLVLAFIVCDQLQILIKEANLTV
jgi:hypothetical protein